MPKIFLIKNRLHQQQLRLLESQNAANNKNDLLGDDQKPLSLIVQKKEGKSYKYDSNAGIEHEPKHSQRYQYNHQW